MRTGTGIFVAFLSGLTIGGVVALLTAPDDGATTRRKIRKLVNDKREDLMDMMDSVKEHFEEGKEELEEAVDKIKRKAKAKMMEMEENMQC